MEKINHIHTEQIPEDMLPKYEQAATAVGNVAVKLAETKDGKFWVHTENWYPYETTLSHDLHREPAIQADVEPGFVAVEISADYSEKSGAPFYDKIKELSNTAE